MMPIVAADSPAANWSQRTGSPDRSRAPTATSELLHKMQKAARPTIAWLLAISPAKLITH